MRTSRLLQSTLVGAVATVVLCSCAAPASTTAQAAAGVQAAAAPAAGGASTQGSTTQAPLTARMVCGGQVVRNLADLDGVKGSIPTATSWQDPVFTCTFTLPEGPLVLTVRQAADKSAATTAFKAAQQAASGTTISSFAALGIPAYSTAADAVSFVKDDLTLVVDPAGLPAQLGPQSTKRAEFASTVASFVLACWRAHG